MSPRNNLLPHGPGAKHTPGQQHCKQPPPQRSGAAQPKMVSQAKGPTKPSTVYRPQPAPKVLQTKTASSQPAQAGQSPRQPSSAPPAYRPQAKQQSPPGAAARKQSGPQAPRAYLPQATPKVLQTKKAQAGANTAVQRHPAPSSGGRQSPGRNVIQAMFWEKTPAGKYVWHYGPVISSWWQQTSEEKDGWGVWLRKSAMKSTAPVTKPTASPTNPVVKAPKNKTVSVSSTPTTTLKVTPTPTPTPVSSSSSSSLPVKPAFATDTALRHLYAQRYPKPPSLGEIEAELKENFSGVPGAKKLHSLLEAYKEGLKPSTLSSSSLTTTVVTPVASSVGVELASVEPTFNGPGSELISAEWHKFQLSKSKPKEGEILVFIGRSSGMSVTSTGRSFTQTGKSAVVHNHAEQLALNEACQTGGPIHLIQNAWPCEKCLEHFTTRKDLAGRRVTITVTSDKGTYSLDNKLKSGSIGQVIIDDNSISYANVVVLA